MRLVCVRMLLHLRLHLHLGECLDVRSEEGIDAVGKVCVEQVVVLLLHTRHGLGLQVLVVGWDAKRLVGFLPALLHDGTICHGEIEDDCIHFLSAWWLPDLVLLCLLTRPLLQTLAMVCVAECLVV